MSNPGTADLVRAGYVSLDFDTISDDLRGQIQANFGAVYNDFAVSSLGIMLLDVVAFGLDTLSFYLDRRATDTYLATARTRKSVTRLSRQLGYKLRGAVASATTLYVVFDHSATYPFVLSKGFHFKGPNNLVFEVVQDVSVPVYLASGYPVLVSEGQTFTETFFSDGTANQVFQLRQVPDGQFIAQGSVQVTVDGAGWSESEFLTFDTTNQFEASVTDDPPSVTFGDGIAGNIPVDGAEVKVTYFATSGKSGLVTAGSISAPVTPLAINFATVNMTISMPTGSQGGDDAESLDHAKEYAPKAYKTRDRAITLEDYESLAGSYADPLSGKVAVAQAVSARSASSDSTLQGLLATINSEVVASPPDSSGAPLQKVAADLQTAGGDLDNINGKVGGAQLYTHDVGLTATDADNTLANTVLTQTRTARSTTQEIGSDATTIAIDATSLSTSIATFSIGPTNQMTSTMNDVLGRLVAAILSAAAHIMTESSTVTTAVDTATTAIGEARNSIALIGRTDTEGSVNAILGNLSSAMTSATDLGTNLADIQLQVIDPTGAMQQVIGNATSGIYDHVDQMLSADCQANLISVPILSVDAGGYYVAPTPGLIDSLQAFLNARKEVTQTVSVCSGAASLVAANVTIWLGVSSGFAQSQVTTAVTTVVNGLLKGRQFGASLYVSDIFNAIQTQVAGISFLNVTLPDPAPVGGVYDVHGNLIIDAAHVITRGLVSVNQAST